MANARGYVKQGHSKTKIPDNFPLLIKIFHLAHILKPHTFRISNIECVRFLINQIIFGFWNIPHTTSDILYPISIVSYSRCWRALLFSQAIGNVYIFMQNFNDFNSRRWELVKNIVRFHFRWSVSFSKPSDIIVATRLCAVFTLSIKGS
jgi:hypothetical protein